MSLGCTIQPLTFFKGKACSTVKEGFLREEIQIASQYMKKSLTFLTISHMQIKTTLPPILPIYRKI